MEQICFKYIYWQIYREEQQVYRSDTKTLKSKKEGKKIRGKSKDGKERKLDS